MKKTTLTTLALAAILTSFLVIISIQPVNALYTSVSTGQLIDPVTQNVIGKYGCSIAYDASGGSENDRFFYPTLEAKSCNGFEVDNIEITVSGTKPNGGSINGFTGFNDLGHNVSPMGMGDDWANALELIYDTINFIEPFGLTELIKLGQPSDGSFWDGWTAGHSQDNNVAWAEFQMGGLHIGDFTQRGLQFKFSLHCDPDIGGTYTLNIHYHLSLIVPMHPVTRVETDIYQTVTYEYTPPHIENVVTCGWLSDNGQGDWGENAEGYAADYNVAYLLTQNDYDGAILVGEMSEEQTGRTDIYIYGCVSDYQSHIYVWVSETGEDYQWNPINPDQFMAESTQLQPIYAGYTDDSFRYIAIVSLHDWGSDNNLSLFLIDCVTTT